ncbi:hypothetical protein REPUB_Repub16aG0118600 [Reevesia pubescens]
MKGLSLNIMLLVFLVASATAQSGSNVIAYWTDYNVTKNNWDYHAKLIYCAVVDGDKPLEWRNQFGYTGYCGSNGPQGEEACGKCLIFFSKPIINFIEERRLTSKKVQTRDKRTIPKEQNHTSSTSSRS